MGLWFVDSFDLQDTAHVGRKYKNPDNPHPELEFQTGEFDSLLKRTGHQSFKGTLQKWHGWDAGVRMGIAFHSSTVQSGIWLRHFNVGDDQFYQLSWEPLTGLTASGFSGVIAGPVPITIINGWNYLEWFSGLHPFVEGEPYFHHVRLNKEDIFTPVIVEESPNAGPRYTTIFPILGNVDDFVVNKSNPIDGGGIHNDFIGPVKIVARRPIGNGILNQWGRFPIFRAQQQNWAYVDDGFHDSSLVPDNNTTYLSAKSSGREESYEMQQIDPFILGIYGFQWNPYGSIPNALNLSITGPPITDIAKYQHIYYNPDQEKRLGNLFELSSSGDEILKYAYRTEFREFDLEEIELGHPNTGSYVNNSRFGFEIETGVTPVGRISQAYIEVVLPEEIPNLPDLPPPTLISLPDTQTFHFTKLWKFVLVDGTTFLFTNHNTEIVHPVDGLTYTPVASMSLSALQRRTGLTITNAEVAGITNDFNKFLGGFTRGAKITEDLLNWQYPWAGVITSQTYTLSEISFDGAKWTSELANSIKRISFPSGDVYGRTCRHVLGDEKCKVNLDSLKITEVTALQVQFKRLQIFFAAPNVGDFGIPDAFGNDIDVHGYWDFGNLEWTSGPNEGTFHEIRQSLNIDLNGVIIKLQVPTAFKITVGETANIWPGCNKLWSTCKDKFENPTDGDIDCGNTKNFGGFPTIPGRDGMFSPRGDAEKILKISNLFPELIGDIFDFLIPFNFRL